MSTPNPTHIDVIARALADTADDGCFDNPPCCENPPCSDMCDGDLTDLDEWRSGEEDRGHWTKLARASVSELTDAGYSIVPSEWLAKHTTTVSGWRIGQTVQVNFDGCKPFTATLLNEDPPNRIEVRDENGDVMFVHASIVTAVAAEEDQ